MASLTLSPSMGPPNLPHIEDHPSFPSAGCRLSQTNPVFLVLAMIVALSKTNQNWPKLKITVLVGTYSNGWCAPLPPLLTQSKGFPSSFSCGFIHATPLLIMQRFNNKEKKFRNIDSNKSLDSHTSTQIGLIRPLIQEHITIRKPAGLLQPMISTKTHSRNF